MKYGGRVEEKTAGLRGGLKVRVQAKQKLNA